MIPALAGLAAVLAWILLRGAANVRIRRPPILDPGGAPYPTREVALSDGTSVPLIDTGTGAPVLLLPGADGMKETWRYQVPALAARHRVIAPDLRSRIPRGTRLERLTTDATEILDACGVGAAIVVGQSLGGAIAMHLAARNPARVRALVVANSLARVSYGHVGLNRVLLVPVAMFTTRYFPTALARLAARLWSRLAVWVFDDSAGAGRVIDYVLWTGPRTVPPRVSNARVNLLKGRDLRGELAAVEADALVMKGPRDTYVPVAWSKEIAALLPSATYVEVPGTGHVSHVSMPDEFNRILLDWLGDRALPTDTREAEA